MDTEKKKTFKLPHIFVLLTAIIVICSIATWILPAGEFDRQVNEAGTEVVCSWYLSYCRSFTCWNF